MGRRIALRMGLRGLGLEAYLAALEREPEEVRRLVDALLLKTTWMFRHAPTFSLLRERLLGDLLRVRAGEKMPAFRAWVVGCSTGEEAFSLAMCMLEAQERAGTALELRVMATDVDQAALDRASRGKVTSAAVEDIPVVLADRWLRARDGAFEVSDDVREIVSFSRFDLLAPGLAAPQDSVIASFDMVCCRNVLIYFEPSAQRAALIRLLKACAPGALVVLGEAERPPGYVGDELTQVSPPVPIYRAP